MARDDGSTVVKGLGALARDRSGVFHALGHTQAKRAHCGRKLFNWDKRISLTYMQWGDGYEYVPPTNLYTTCLACVKELS